MKTPIRLVLIPAACLVMLWSVQSAETPAAQSTPTSDPRASTEAGDPSTREDPAILRRKLLSRLDEHIDHVATQSRLEMRRIVDEVCPVPYLGVDSEVAAGGLSVTAVYANTGAERCGLRKGDLIRSVDGTRIESKAALARAVRSHRVSDPFALEIERNGSALALRARLGARPEEDEDDDEQFPDLAVPWPAPPAPLAFDLERESVGGLPSAFESVLGGHGRPGAWRVIKSDPGAALRQEDGDTTGIRFPMLLVRDWQASDAVARVRFRYAGGRVDRAAGIVLRYRDPGNYLVARANAAEGDLRIFRVVNGDRRTLPGAIAKGATDDDRWHTLEFKVEGSRLSATLDGSVQTSAYDSFFMRGRAGLWTKSDSITEFDDLRFEATR